MAGTVTIHEAERYWDKYNKDGSDVLTVDEVRQCLAEVYDTVDDADVKEKFVFFGQSEPKDLTKDEFIKGMVRTDKVLGLKKAFKEMDKDGNGSLTKDELSGGLTAQGFDKDVADIIIEELEFDSDGKYSIDEFLETVAFSQQFAATYNF